MDQNTLSLLEFSKVLEHLSIYCLSEAGKREVLSLVPCGERDELSFVKGVLQEGFSLKEEIVSLLRPFPPLEGVFDHIRRGEPLDEDGLWGVRSFLEVAKGVYSFLSSLGEDYPHLTSLLSSCSWPRRAFQGLSRCLDPSGEIRDESTPELLSIRGEIRKLQRQCTKKVNDFLFQEDLSHMLQDEYLTISSDRYVIALKSNFKGRIKGIIHDYSQSGETCYFEPLFLVELNNKLQELRQREREEKNRILRYLTSLISQEDFQIRGLYHLLIHIDVLRAKLLFAQELNCSILEVGGLQISIRELRHPLLYLEKGDATQPVDLCLEDGHRALLLTGGNSGGKTVCLKSLGLASLMALAGIPVPCAEGSHIPFWDKLYVFLGDEQSIEESLSTYTAQIKKLRNIWEEVDASTLVLLDEFGSGTDPSQGAALAQAVLDCLMERGAWIFSVTHFPALKLYALKRDDIRVASVLFDPVTKRPLYRLAYDQIGTSQALDVAREFGLPEEILKRAERYLLVGEEDTSHLISRLNSLALEREKEIEMLLRQRKRLEERERELREKYEKKLSSLGEEISSTIREIVRQLQQEKIQKREAIKRLRRVREHLRGAYSSAPPSLNKREVEISSLKKGDKVLYIPWNKKAVVEEVSQGRIKINISGISLWAGEGEIEERKERQGGEKGVSYRVSAASSPSFSLDLRGKRALEAEGLLRQFIDRAMLRGGSQVQIIHGRGEGILRKVVREVLQGMPGVKDFYFAPEDRGGDGVTIVEFEG